MARRFRPIQKYRNFLELSSSTHWPDFQSSGVGDRAFPYCLTAPFFEEQVLGLAQRTGSSREIFLYSTCVGVIVYGGLSMGVSGLFTLAGVPTTPACLWYFGALED